MIFSVPFLLSSFILLLQCIKGNDLENVDVTGEKNEMEIDLFPGHVLIRDLPRKVTAVLTVQNISLSNTSLVCQVHIQDGNLTLSLTRPASVDTAVTGRDIGVVSILKQNQDTISWYLFSKLNVSVTVLFHVTALNKNDPLPGGCNQEFDLENDPNIHIQSGQSIHNVIFQWSNIGFPRNVIPPPDCEDSTKQGTMEYEMYVYYIKEHNFEKNTFFEYMKKMLNPEDIVKYGMKVKSFTNNQIEISKAIVPSYKSQGIIYGLIVKEKRLGVSGRSAYVSRAIYTCNLADGSCDNVDAGAMVLATIGGIVGLFLLLLGHRFFKTENFIFGFLAFALIFYMVFVSATDESNTVCLVLAAVFGIVGGLLWLAFWWNCGIPLASVLLIGLVAGYIFSSTLFYTPFGNLSYWENTFNYGMTFACGCLILPVVLLCYTRILNIFACAFVGSFCTILALDYYLFGGMKMILVNSIRHATVPGYSKVTVVGPFQTNDIILSVIWFFLLVLGMSFQLYRENGKAPFPPCPRKMRQRNLQPALSRRLTSEQDNDDDERRPLVPETTPRSYASNRNIGEMHQPVSPNDSSPNNLT